MARQNTSYLQNPTPRRRPSFSPKSIFKPLKRSSISYNGYQKKPPPSVSRFGQTKANLSKIHEESMDQDDTRLQDEAYREFHTNDLVEEQRDSEDEDDMAYWDEEATLVAMMHTEFGESEDHRLSALANSLKTPITAHGLILKQHLVQTLVPTAKQSKSIHATLETKVDIPFEAGLLAFNDASRTMENLALREEDELKVAYAKNQNNIKKLFTQLELTYARRDRICTEFHEALDLSVQRAKSDVSTLPGDVERIITTLDKKSKELEKDTAGASAKSKEKMLRKLLNKF